MKAIIDKSGRELAQHGTASFPCAAYTTLDDGFPWHWHEEMEMLYVEAGSMTIAAAGQRYHLNAEEAIFINANIPHAVLPNIDGYIERGIVFQPRLLYGSTDSIFWEGYFKDLLQCAAIEGVPLLRHERWRYEAAGYIKEACILCDEKPFMYEFAVRGLLAQVCVAIWKHVDEESRRRLRSGRAKAENVKGMMWFLMTHMQEEVTLKQLASFAQKSERSCQREFQSQIGISPFQYLSQIRLVQAANLLKSGTDSVSEICMRCGFRNTSYFTKKFRERYGVSPREYRG